MYTVRADEQLVDFAEAAECTDAGIHVAADPFAVVAAVVVVLVVLDCGVVDVRGDAEAVSPKETGSPYMGNMIL